MSILYRNNSLFDILMIVFSDKNYGFSTRNIIDYTVLFNLKKFQKHKNYYNFCRMKYKKYNLKNVTLFKVEFIEKKKIFSFIK